MSLVVESTSVQKRIVIEEDMVEQLKINLLVEGEAVVKIKIGDHVKRYVIRIKEYYEKSLREGFKMESEFKELEDKVIMKLSDSIANLSKVLEDAERNNIPVITI